MSARKKAAKSRAAQTNFPARSLLASAIGLTLCSSGVLAQANTDKAEDLETIIVVGHKMETRGMGDKLTAPIIDTPKSITVVSSELIEQRGATSLVDALKSVPGITFNAGEGGTPAGDNLKIRGSDAGSDVFVDGVRDPGSQMRDIFALEQVEVLMGPGSVYGGRGSAGGSVNLVTKRPHLEDSLSMRVGAGTDGYERVALDGNYQINDGTAARLNVLYHEGDVPGRDSVSYEHKGVAPSVAFGLDGDTQVSLDYYYYRTDDIPDYSIPYDNGTPAKVDRNNFYGLLNRDFQKTGADIGTVEIRHKISPTLSISNTTRYGETSNDYVVTNPDDTHGNVPNGFVWRGTKNRNAETVTKANLTNLVGSFNLGGMEHNFSTGVEFSKEEMTRTGYTVSSSFGGRDGVTDPTSCSYPGNIGPASGYECTTLDNPNPHDPWVGTVTPTDDPTVTETDTKSAYFFDTVTLSDQWLLNAGVRYDDYKTSQRGTTGPAITNKSDFWNYQVGVVYKPSPDASIYLSTGTSSRPSGADVDGTDAISSGTADLEPERTKTYELGAKWLLADGRVSLQSSIFQNVTDNARVATEPGRGAPQDTVGKQEVKGFSFAVNGQLTSAWNVTASYTYLDSELVDNGDFGYSGNVFPNTPENSFDLWTTYAITSDIVVGAGATYVDKRFGNTANTTWVPDYTIYDLMATWRINDQMDLQLNVQNLTDEDYFTRPFSAHYASIGAGRSSVVTFSYKM